jgi:hypothetical protein
MSKELTHLAEQRDFLTAKSGSSSSAEKIFEVAVTITGAPRNIAYVNGSYMMNTQPQNGKPQYQQLQDDKKHVNDFHIAYDNQNGKTRWIIRSGSQVMPGTLCIDCSEATCDFATLNGKKNWKIVDKDGNVSSSDSTKEMVATVSTQQSPAAAAASPAAVVQPPTDVKMKQYIAQVKINHANVDKAYNMLTDTSPDADRTAFDNLLTKVVTELTTAQQQLDAYKNAAAAVNPLSPTAEDKKIPEKVLSEYTAFYNEIIDKLFTSGEREAFVEGLNKDTWAVKIESLTTGDSGPKPPFLEAIKSRSLNSSAIPSIEDAPNDINHNLMKAVFTILDPSRLMTELVKIASFQTLDPPSLDTLLTLLPGMLSGSTDISQEINKEYAKVIAPTSTGGSSSSTSKKNRKSHKSYHPGIGKTRKHSNSHDEPKRVSFVHHA